MQLISIYKTIFTDVAKILKVEGEIDDRLQLEMLMDAASLLIAHTRKQTKAIEEKLYTPELVVRDSTSAAL